MRHSGDSTSRTCYRSESLALMGRAGSLELVKCLGLPLHTACCLRAADCTWLTAHAGHGTSVVLAALGISQ